MRKVKSSNKIQKINRTDIFSKKKRSEVMSRVKSKESKIETRVGLALWSKGVRYRKNTRSLLGNPDFSIKSRKLVVFVDSCFWHGCSDHFKAPKSNKAFWKKKINRNRQRDLDVTKHYKKLGWNIFRIWEHQVTKNIETFVERIVKYLRK